MRFYERSMLIQALSTCFFLSGLLALQVEAETLQWKFAVGDVYQLEVQQTVKQTTTVLLQPVEATTSLSMGVRWEITAIRPDGSAELTQTFEKISLKVQAEDSAEVDYDSDRTKQPSASGNQLHQAISPLLKTPFQIVMQPDGQISEVKASEDSLKKIREASGSVKLRAAMSPEGLQNMLALVSTPLPEKEVQAGDTWQRERRSGVGGQELEVAHNFKYTGPEEVDGVELAKIEFSTTLKPADAEGASAQGPVIQSQDSTGVYWFDAGSGYPTRCEQTQTLVTNKKLREFTIEVSATSQTRCSLTKQP